MSTLSISNLSYAQIRLKDISGHAFEYEITKLFEAGIIKGFPDGTFKPDMSISRTDTAIVIAIAKKLTLENPKVSPYKDLLTTHYGYKYIIAVKNAGFMKGYPDGTFKPDKEITRSELAILLGLVKGISEEVSKKTKLVLFAQDEASIPTWAAGWVSLGVKPENQYLNFRNELGIRVFSPQAKATRGEVAFGVYQVLNPPKYGDTVNIALNQEPNSLNSWLGPIALTYAILGNIGLPASSRDNNWSLYPGLLREIPTIENGLWSVKGDNMEIIYRLRSDLKFHDGKPASIDDWAYSFMVFMDPLAPISARSLEEKVDLNRGLGAHGIKGFDLLDNLSVKVYYKELDWKANLWLPAMSPHGTMLYARHTLETPYKKMKETGNKDYLEKDEILARKPIGTGAYKVVDWKTGSYMLLERNPDFILGTPLFKYVVYRFIPDTTTLLARVISGRDVDVSIGMSIDQALQLEARKLSHTRAILIKGAVFEHIGVNFRNSNNPMLDLRVRKAFLMGIDREGIVQSLFRNLEPVAHSFYPPHHWAFDDSVVVKYPYDPAQARRLLDEAGWKLSSDGLRYKEGKRLTLELTTTSGMAIRESIQAILKSQLKEIGIDLDISKNLPSSILLGRDVFYGDGSRWQNLILFGWTTSPLTIGDAMFRSDYIPINNGYGWINFEATELLKNASKEMGETDRRNLLRRFQKILSEELPVLPLYYRSMVVTAKINLASLKPIHVAGIFTPWNAYEWYFR